MPVEGVQPSRFVKAYVIGSPPPVDQPELASMPSSKSKSNFVFGGGKKGDGGDGGGGVEDRGKGGGGVSGVGFNDGGGRIDEGGGGVGESGGWHAFAPFE